MSERWVLVPVEPTEEMSSHQMPGSWELSLAARPPVSREWLEAAVERAARAMTDLYGKDNLDKMPGNQRDMWLFEARAAILAALELEDTP